MQRHNKPELFCVSREKNFVAETLLNSRRMEDDMSLMGLGTQSLLREKQPRASISLSEPGKEDKRRGGI